MRGFLGGLLIAMGALLFLTFAAYLLLQHGAPSVPLLIALVGGSLVLMLGGGYVLDSADLGPFLDKIGQLVPVLARRGERGG